MTTVSAKLGTSWEQDLPITDFFPILETLRESGRMNMFGAPRWLRENWGLSRSDAKMVFLKWTEFKEAECQDLS
jgi:hypothetical protein